MLIEQVFGSFDDSRLYDTSHLQYKDKVYYFKRLYNPGQDPIDVSKSFLDSAAFDFNGIESTLQLFSYSFNTKVENEMDNFFLDEFDEASSDVQ